jgi:hypothetical protein
MSVALPGTTQPFAPANPKVLTHTFVRSNQVAAYGEIVYVFCQASSFVRRAAGNFAISRDGNPRKSAQVQSPCSITWGSFEIAKSFGAP